LSAAERGARVLPEKAPDDWLGGNSYFTAGAIRTVHGGLHDVTELVSHVEPDTVLEPYTSEDYALRDARPTFVAAPAALPSYKRSSPAPRAVTGSPAG
jgi:hypothetical protein